MIAININVIKKYWDIFIYQLNFTNYLISVYIIHCLFNQIKYNRNRYIIIKEHLMVLILTLN